MTRADVNGIVKGTTVPHARTVELFKRVLLRERPEILGSVRAPAPSLPIAPDIAEDVATLSEEERADLEEMLRAALRLVKRGTASEERRARKAVAQRKSEIRDTVAGEGGTNAQTDALGPGADPEKGRR